MDFTDGYFDTGEVRLHYIEGPKSGPPLVLMHGATSNCHDWEGLFPALSQHWHIYSLDVRGHGLSGRPATLEGYHLSHNVQDTVAFLRGVVREPAVLMGHSYGAVIAALAGQPGADWLRGIVLEDPPLVLRRDNQESQAFLDFFTWMYQVRSLASTVEEILPALSQQNPAAPVDSLRPWAQTLAWLDPNYLLAITTGNKRETAMNIDFAAHIAGIACPVLVMQADLAKGAALMAEDLDFFMTNAKNARLVTFPGCGHGIHNEQTAAFLKAFEDFTTALA